MRTFGAAERRLSRPPLHLGVRARGRALGAPPGAPCSRSSLPDILPVELRGTSSFAAPALPRIDTRLPLGSRERGFGRSPVRRVQAGAGRGRPARRPSKAEAWPRMPLGM